MPHWVRRFKFLTRGKRATFHAEYASEEAEREVSSKWRTCSGLERRGRIKPSRGARRNWRAGHCTFVTSDAADRDDAPGASFDGGPFWRAHEQDGANPVVPPGMPSGGDLNEEKLPLGSEFYKTWENFWGHTHGVRTSPCRWHLTGES